MIKTSIVAASSPILAAHQSRKINLSPPLVIGEILLLCIIILVIFAPLLTPYDPIAPNLEERFSAISTSHLLGTDNFGRDIFTRILYGGRVDLQIAFISTLLSLLLGGVIGSISGYFGKWVDSFFGAIINLTMAFPVFVLVVAIMAMLGPGLRNMYIAILVISWVSYARIFRAEVLSTRDKEYIQALRALGSGHLRILLKHILPNVIISPIIFATSDAVLNMIFAGTLGYLGLGIEPPNPEWGSMIAEARPFIITNPLLVMAPSAAIIIAGIAFSLIGDGLADQIRIKK